MSLGGGRRARRIAFPATAADRVASGDPRLSVQERYPSHGVYVARVAVAAKALAAERLLLDEDVLRSIARAAVSPVGG